MCGPCWAQRPRCALLEPGYGFLKLIFQKKSNGNITKSCRRNSQSLRRNFPTLRHNFPEPLHNSFPTIFAAHGLAESMEKRSFVQFRVLGPPLCQSSVCMVSHSSTALTTIDLWQRHFWMSCVTMSGLRLKKKTPFGNPALFFKYATPI